MSSHLSPVHATPTLRWRQQTAEQAAQAAQGVGAALAGLCTAATIRRWSEPRIVAAGMALFATGTVLTAIPSVHLVLAGNALAGTGLTAALIALLVLLQRLAPTNMQGRIFAGVEVATTVPQTAAIAGGAALITVVPYQVILAGSAALMLLAATLIVLRRLPDEEDCPPPVTRDAQRTAGRTDKARPRTPAPASVAETPMISRSSKIPARRSRCSRSPRSSGFAWRVPISVRTRLRPDAIARVPVVTFRRLAELLAHDPIVHASGTVRASLVWLQMHPVHADPVAPSQSADSNSC